MSDTTAEQKTKDHISGRSRPSSRLNPLKQALAGAAAIAIVILARACAVALPIALLKRLSPVTWRAFPIMVWGGLRGAVSVALALSLPDGAMRELIVTVTYVVVIFSVIARRA